MVEKMRRMWMKVSLSIHKFIAHGYNWGQAERVGTRALELCASTSVRKWLDEKNNVPQCEAFKINGDSNRYCFVSMASQGIPSEAKNDEGQLTGTHLQSLALLRRHFPGQANAAISHVDHPGKISHPEQTREAAPAEMVLVVPGPQRFQQSLIGCTAGPNDGFLDHRVELG